MPGKTAAFYRDLKLLIRRFNYFKAVFQYPKMDLEVDYEQYWRKRIQDKDQYRFSLNMKWWEKPFSMRYQKSKIAANIIEPGSSVMDIGCGDGLVLQFIHSRKGIRGIGVDMAGNAVESLRKLGFKGIVADITHDVIEKLPVSDYILLLDILEHLQVPEKLMLRLKPKFNKGIIVNVPNTGHFIYRLRLLFGRTPIQGLYFPGEHVRYWSVRDFKWWSRLLGYKIVKHQSSSGIAILKNVMPNLFSASQVYLLSRDK